MFEAPEFCQGLPDPKTLTRFKIHFQNGSFFSWNFGYAGKMKMPKITALLFKCRLL